MNYDVKINVEKPVELDQLNELPREKLISKRSRNTPKIYELGSPQNSESNLENTSRQSLRYMNQTEILSNYYSSLRNVLSKVCW